MKKILLSLLIIASYFSQNTVYAVTYDFANDVTLTPYDLTTDGGAEYIEGFLNSEIGIFNDKRPPETDPISTDTRNQGGVSCGSGFCNVGYKCDKRFLAVLPENDADILGFFERLIQDIEEYTQAFILGTGEDAAPNPVFKCSLVSPINLSKYKDGNKPSTVGDIASKRLALEDTLNQGINFLNDLGGFNIGLFTPISDVMSSLNSLTDSIPGVSLFKGFFGSMNQDKSVSKYFSGVDPKTGRNTADLSKGVMDPGVPVNIINKEALPVEIFGNLPLPVTLSEPGPIDVKILADQQSQYDDILEQQNKNTAYQSLEIGKVTFDSLSNSSLVTNPYSIFVIEPEILSLTEMNKNVLSTLANQPEYSIENIAKYQEEYAKKVSKIISPTYTFELDERLKLNNDFKSNFCPDDTKESAGCVLSDLYGSKNYVADAIRSDELNRQLALGEAKAANQFATENPYLNQTDNTDPFKQVILKPGKEIEDLKKEYNKLEIDKLKSATDCFSTNPEGLVDATLKPFVKNQAIQLIRTGPQTTQDIGDNLQAQLEDVGQKYLDGLTSGVKCSVARELNSIGSRLLGELVTSIGVDLGDFQSPFDGTQTPNILTDLVAQGWLPSWQEINQSGGIDPSAWGLDPNILPTVNSNISQLDQILRDYNEYKNNLENE